MVFGFVGIINKGRFTKKKKKTSQKATFHSKKKKFKQKRKHITQNKTKQNKTKQNKTKQKITAQHTSPSSPSLYSSPPECVLFKTLIVGFKKNWPGDVFLSEKTKREKIFSFFFFFLFFAILQGLRKKILAL